MTKASWIYNKNPLDLWHKISTMDLISLNKVYYEVSEELSKQADPEALYWLQDLRTLILGRKNMLEENVEFSESKIAHKTVF